MDLSAKKCVPCEVGMPPFNIEKANEYLTELNDSPLDVILGIRQQPETPESSEVKDSGQARMTGSENWEIVDEEGKLKIRKRFKFGSYLDGIEFVNKIAKVAQGEDHHPDLFVGYKKVTVNLTTHNIGGLSENDFILAAKIDKLQREEERSNAK